MDDSFRHRRDTTDSTSRHKVQKQSVPYGDFHGDEIYPPGTYRKSLSNRIKYQSTENADEDGCLKFNRPLELSPFLVEKVLFGA